MIKNRFSYFFKNFLKKYKYAYGCIFLFNILICVFSYYSILLIKDLINMGILAKNMSFLKKISINLVSIYVVIEVISYFKVKLDTYFVIYSLYRIRMFFLKRMSRIDYKDIKEKNKPLYITRIEEDSRVIGSFIFKEIPEVISNAIYVILGVVIIYRSNIFIAIVLTIIITIYIVILKHFNVIYKSKVKKYLHEKDEAYKKLSENMMGLELLNLFNRVNFFSKRYSKQYRNFKNENISRLMYELKYNVFFDFLKKIYPFMIYVWGGVLFLKDRFSFGEITFLVMYINIIVSSLEKLISINSSYQSYKTSLYRLEDILLEEREKEKRVYKNKIEIEKIELKGISFKNILKNVNIELNKDETIQIKGENGKGKSVLLKIISGLLPFDSGEIIINDEIKIDSKNYKSLRKYVQYIESKSNFFTGTVEENLKIANKKLKEKNGYGLFDFFKLEDKMEEKNFSLGQLQKIRVLRGLSSEKSILCLDEISSNLDKISQKQLEELISRMKGIKFIVTHEKDIKVNKVIEL